jgi:arylsulfatase A-like enzyme
MKLLKLILLFIPLALNSCTRQAADTTLQLPNIILISADDLGWSDIGCYGSEVQTPNLDKLGEGGMRFTRFHNTSKCFPSRASLLTGVYAQQCNYDKTHTNPITNAVTLGEVLRTAGYRTLWSGKHHGLENPVYRGFDRYYGLKDGACNYFNPGDQRPGEGAPARKGRPGNKTVRAWCIDSVTFMPYTPEEKDFYTTDYFTNYALQWLDEYRNEENPFFLYLAYTAPHDPLMAWPEDIARYRGLYNAGYQKIREARYKKQLAMGLIDDHYQLSKPEYQLWEELPNEERLDEISRMEVYAAMIDRMDQNIGRVLNKLQETGKLDNTLILFVSDNGASAEVVNIEDDYGEIGTLTRWESLRGNWANVGNTPFRYYKNYSYEGGINTPLIAWWPGKIKPGAISEYPGHFIDFMATFIDLTGAEYPVEFNGQEITPMQGESLLPVFRGENPVREKPLFWEWGQGQAVYHDSWKLVRHGLNNPWELYNLDEDPVEITNLTESDKDKQAQLEQLFNDWKAGLPQ